MKSKSKFKILEKNVLRISMFDYNTGLANSDLSPKNLLSLVLKWPSSTHNRCCKLGFQPKLEWKMLVSQSKNDFSLSWSVEKERLELNQRASNKGFRNTLNILKKQKNENPNFGRAVERERSALRNASPKERKSQEKTMKKMKKCVSAL